MDARAIRELAPGHTHLKGAPGLWRSVNYEEVYLRGNDSPTARMSTSRYFYNSR